MDLFIEHGFDATTIDDIAAAVGTSTRSVFRHFDSKEDIVISKFELGAQRMLAELRERPDDEPASTSLRGLLLDTVDVVSAREKPLQRIVFETPALLAAYLKRLQHLQNAVVAELVDRSERSGVRYAEDDPSPRAVTAAMFGCLVAAQYAWLASETVAPFAAFVDRAIAAVFSESHASHT